MNWYEEMGIEGEGVGETLGAYESANDYITASMSKPTGLIKPSDEAGEDEWNTFNSTLREYNGVPESSEMYDIKYKVGEEERSLDYGADGVEDLVKHFHSINLNNTQASGIMQMLIDEDVAREAATNKFYSEQDEALREAWGNSYDKNMDKAKEAIVRFGGEEFMSFVEDSGALKRADVAQVFAKIGDALGGGMSPRGDNIVTRSSDDIWEELQKNRGSMSSGERQALYTEYQKTLAAEK